MRTSIVQGALSMGIDSSRIKMALRSRMSELAKAGRDASTPFKSTNELVDYAFGVHREQEERASIENNETESPFASSTSLASAGGSGGGAGSRGSGVEDSGSAVGELRPRDFGGSTSSGWRDSSEPGTTTATSATESEYESHDEVNTTVRVRTLAQFCSHSSL